MREHGTRHGVEGQLILGLVILTFGFLWTLDSLSVVETGNVLRWWPILLIWLGAAKLTGRGTTRNPTFGVMALVLGTGLTLDRLGIIDFGFALFWPFVILLLGASIVARALRIGPNSDPRHSDSSQVAILSGVSHKSHVLPYAGGTVSAVMGGVELDLRDARPASPELVIDVLIFMGGVDITVPPDWAVEVRTIPLMGGVEDKTGGVPVGAPKATLIIRGAVIMGGLDVKS